MAAFHEPNKWLEYVEGLPMTTSKRGLHHGRFESYLYILSILFRFNHCIILDPVDVDYGFGESGVFKRYSRTAVDIKDLIQSQCLPQAPFVIMPIVLKSTMGMGHSEGHANFVFFNMETRTVSIFEPARGHVLLGMSV